MPYRADAARAACRLDEARSTTTTWVEVGMSEARRIGQQIGIPACPPLLADIMHESRQAAPDRSWIMRLILQDAALSAGILKTMNSPMYDRHRPLASIEVALATCSLDYFTQVVAGLLLRRAFAACGDPAVDAFWAFAGERAVVIGHVARELGVAEFEDARTFGLFRDCGVPLMMIRFADYAGWLATSQDGAVPDLIKVERVRYGIDHALAGALLARSWFLPGTVWLPISLHHLRDLDMAAGTPDADRIRQLVAVGVLADSVDASHRMRRMSEYWAREQEYALCVLGVSAQEIGHLSRDAALLLSAPLGEPY
jgi:HD-like signal output (HDOD) protein